MRGCESNLLNTSVAGEASVQHGKNHWREADIGLDPRRGMKMFLENHAL